MIGFSVADELDKLERLKNSNMISNDEYTRLRARTYSNRHRSWIRVAGSPRIDDWDTGRRLRIEISKPTTTSAFNIQPFAAAEVRS